MKKLTVGVREFPLKFLQYCITASEQKTGGG